MGLRHLVKKSMFAKVDIKNGKSGHRKEESKQCLMKYNLIK